MDLTAFEKLVGEFGFKPDQSYLENYKLWRIIKEARPL
jgi:hypothetical protein